MGIVFALSVNSEFKAKITPDSLYDFICRTRDILDSKEKDVFSTYDSVESVKQSMDGLVSVSIMKNENGEYPLTGIGLMRGNSTCAAGNFLNPEYSSAARKAAEDWFSQWERK